MNILQIGCNDGNDHVFKFVTENKPNIENIYLLDANEKCITVCKKQYIDIPNTHFFHYAITTTNEPHVDLFIPLENDIAAQSSLVDFHLANHSCHNFRKETVPAKNINQLFRDLKLTTIDRLYIDVEGLDVDIVNSINFEEFTINFLMFEFIHSDGTMSRGGPKLDTCKQKLQNLGYSIHEEEFNIIAQKTT